MDVPAGFWAQEQIQYGAGLGLLAGYPDGSFRPNGTISRAEFLAVLERALQIQPQAGQVPFADVRATDWFAPGVATALEKGIILASDYGTRMNPTGPISRREMARMIARGFGETISLPTDLPPEYASQGQPSKATFTDVKGGDRDQAAIARVAELGIITGYPDGSFGPGRPATRAEAVTMIWRALDRQQPVGDPYANVSEWAWVQVTSPITGRTYGNRWGMTALIPVSEVIDFFRAAVENDIQDGTLKGYLEQFATPQVAQKLITWRDGWKPGEVYTFSMDQHYPLAYSATVAVIGVQVTGYHGTGDPLGTVTWDRKGTFYWTFYLRRPSAYDEWTVVGADLSLDAGARGLASGWKPYSAKTTPTVPLADRTHQADLLFTNAADGKTYLYVQYNIGTPDENPNGWSATLHDIFAAAKGTGGNARVLRIGGLVPSQSRFADLIAQLESEAVAKPAGYVVLSAGAGDCPLWRTEVVGQDGLSGYFFGHFTVAGVVVSVNGTAWHDVARSSVWQEMLKTGVTQDNEAQYNAQIAGLIH